MKSGKLKLAALILAIFMILGLAACNGGTGTPQTSPTASSGGSASPESPSTPSATPPASDSATPAAPSTEVLKVGALLHLTEWFAAVDMTNYYEFNAMVAYINENLGGWKVGDTTYTLEAVIVDGRSDGEALRGAAMSLVDAGVKFTSVTNDFWVVACQDILEDAGVLQSCNYPVFVPGYLSPDNPLTFTASNGSVGDYASGFEILNKAYPDVKSVIFVNDDNGVNEGVFGLMKTYGAQYGIEVLDNYLMYAGDTTDYSAIALQIVESGADCFMGNGSPSAYGALLKEVRALGSDAVMACLQGKPITMVMEYVPADARYNGFTVSASTRESDRDQNTDMLNAVVEKVRELYGDEQAANFDGAACNNLYVMLQFMQIAGSVDPYDVAKAWENASTIDTIFGLGKLGGLETYGIKNHALGLPRPVSIMDQSDPDGWKFWGWVEVTIP